MDSETSPMLLSTTGVETCLKVLTSVELMKEGSSLSIDFSGAVLKKANFKNTVWGDHCSWQDADFSGSDFSGINNVSSCVFTRCNFSNTLWSQADLWQSTFEDCNLTDANFDDAELIEVRFKSKS